MVEYEARTPTTKVMFDNAHAAQVFIEHHGEGSVTKFIGVPNMPHCLPATVWKCNALWTFNRESHVWEARSIFSGCCEVLDHVSPTGEVCA